MIILGSSGIFAYNDFKKFSQSMRRDPIEIFRGVFRAGPIAHGR